ncbi:MAG TPA: SDR family oxidoreductase [Vicinamibacterales bacterium]|nr:SDR family oxidoreductase [Vicinamibacterales bacterium]
MTHKQSAFAISGLVLGATLVARQLRRLRALDLTGRVVLITGGSRGLGLLMAREVGHLGAQVVIAARDEAELLRAQRDLQAHGIETSILVADVATEAQAKRMIEQVLERHARLDVLINNAGVITVGPVDHMNVADFEEAMATHFWGPLHTMLAAIPHMRETSGGRIVNISSIGGKIGVPHLAPYCASKFALTGVSTSLRTELVRYGILVTTVCPGLMRTGSPFNAWFKGRHRAEFAWFAIADSMPLLSIDGRRAAAQIVDAMRHGDAELVVSWPARLAVAAEALAPNTLAKAMTLVNRVLPAPTGMLGNESHTGWQSGSRWAPSPLTRLSERSAAENNEVPQRP